MSESLRDQLLKAGLGKKAKPETKPAPTPVRKHHASHTPHPSRKPGNPGPQKVQPGASEPNLAHAYAMRAKQEKDEREQAQRDIERIAREKRERKHRIASLLDGMSLNAADADVPRHFPHGNKIRRIYCTAAQLQQLNHGDLGVVQMAGRYLLVTREIALQAQAIDGQALVLLCDPNAPAEDDVPADLVW